MLWSKEFDECDDKKRALNDYSEFIDRLESISKTPSDVQDFFHTYYHRIAYICNHTKYPILHLLIYYTKVQLYHF